MPLVMPLVMPPRVVFSAAKHAMNPSTCAFQVINTVADDVLYEMMGGAPYMTIAALNIEHLQCDTDMLWTQTPWPDGVPLRLPRSGRVVYPDTRKGVVHSLFDAAAAATVPRVLGIDRYGGVACDLGGVAVESRVAVLYSIRQQVAGLAVPATFFQSLQTDRCVDTVNRISIR